MQSFVPHPIHKIKMMDFQSSIAFLELYLIKYPVFSFIAFLLLFSVWSWYLKKDSQVGTCWPFFGNLPSLLWNSNRIHDWITEIFSSLGRGSFYAEGPVFSKLGYLVTCDPQNLEYILRSNFDNFPKGSDFKEVFDPFGDGIFTVDSDIWRAQRKLAHANFNSAAFRSLVTKTNRKIVEEHLIPLLAHAAKQGLVIDLQDVCSRFAYDSNRSTIIGYDEGYLSADLPNNEFAEAFDKVQEAILYRHTMPIFLWKLMHWLGIGIERKLSKACKAVDGNLQRSIFRKRIELLAGVETFDLLSSYIKSSEDKSDKFLRDAMLSFTAAGKDAITSGLVWFFWSVCTTPRVEIKILEELRELAFSLKKNKDDDEGRLKWPWVFESDELKGLVYLHAALLESLRLYPPVPLNRKAVLKEDVLPDGTRVKPGMHIILAFYCVGRMTWIWGEDCLEFKPERWIDDSGKISHESMSKFFAFNVGPRTCLGKHMSLAQMKSAIASILFNFHIEVVEGQHICPRPSTNLLMKNGLMVRIKKRLMC